METKALPTKELWFVTGSQHLYGPEAIEQVSQNSADIVAGLDGAAAIPVEVVAKPVLTTPEEIKRVLLEANAADECIGVIAWMHTFSPSKMWIAGLGVLQKPLLHLHTQHNRDLPWADIDMDFIWQQQRHGKPHREQNRIGMARGVPPQIGPDQSSG